MSTKQANPGPGVAVVAYLRDPRERCWGILLGLETAGVWLRGVDMNAFEDWARSIAAGRDDGVTASTLFIPHLRIEKIVVDEDYASVPSMNRKLQEMTGRKAEELLLDGGEDQF